MRYTQERRAVQRTWLGRDALIIIPRLRGVYSCGVRDLSGRGAGLRLPNIALLPTDFDISFDGVRHTFGCRLIWRHGDFAGIAFQPAANGQRSPI
jgi:hypothetical protein